MDSFFSVTIPLELEKWQIDLLDKRLCYLRSIYNQTVEYVRKQYSAIAQRNEFRKINSSANITPFFLKNAFYDKKYNITFSLTRYGIRNLILRMLKQDIGNNSTYKQHGIMTHSVDAFASYIYKSIEVSTLRHKKEINLTKKDEYHYNHIIFQKDKERFDGLKVDFENNIINININGRQQKQAKMLSIRMRPQKKNGSFTIDNMPTSLDNIYKILIKRRFIRSKKNYYITFCKKGQPVYKSLEIGKGKVGIDLGPSTIAYAADTKVGLEHLSCNVFSLEEKAKRLSESMNRSRRQNNQDKYNEDGTYKVGTKGSNWIKSNRYKKLQTQHYNILRKIVEIRKHYQQLLIREIVTLGDVFVVEKNDFWKWKIRSKKDLINPKTGKNQSKKSRLGTSIKRNSPRYFLDRLSSKISYLGGIVNIVSPQNSATQFNFTNETFVKRELKEKEIDLGDNIMHHRDILAAFNLQHLDTNADVIKAYDVNKMRADYEHFCKMESAFLHSTQ